MIATFRLIGVLGIGVLFGLVGTSWAADSRGELVFAVSAALKGGDKGYFEQCFAFAGSDAAARGEVKAIIDEILRWRTPHVTTTERAPGAAEGAPELNGDWQFQVHIHKGPLPSTGYVFPAGKAAGSGEYKILLVAE